MREGAVEVNDFDQKFGNIFRKISLVCSFEKRLFSPCLIKDGASVGRTSSLQWQDVFQDLFDIYL